MRFLYSKEHNRAIKVESEDEEFCLVKDVQVVRYANKDIRHGKGRTTYPKKRFEEEFKDYQECTEAEYLDVLKDYHAKEREDAARLKKHLYGE